MTTTHWLRRTVSLITVALLASCGGGTHELGTSPDAGTSSTTGGADARAGAGGAAADAPMGGSGGTSAAGGVTSAGGKSTASGGAGGSSSSSRLCCNMLACPGGYTLIGVLSGDARSSSDVTCPAGAKCQTFTTSCGCNTVLCAEGADAGVADAAGGQGGNAGTGGSGGVGGTSGSSSGCLPAPPCNWCGGQSITDSNGCVISFRCANGANPCSIQPCSDSSACAAGQTCRDRLCWPGDAGAGGTGGTGGNSGSSCRGAPSCNWCGGEIVKDSNGCVTGYRCANGIDPCKTSSCSASAPCAAGYTCSNMLCWPNDGGAGDAGTTGLCGGKVCGANEACCGPAECGRCVNALSGQYCPDNCTAQACGPSGAPCKAGEVCLNLVYQTTSTRTLTASCQPNPCGTETLSCTCAKSLCGTSNVSCSLADPASAAVVCSTK